MIKSYFEYLKENDMESVLSEEQLEAINEKRVTLRDLKKVLKRYGSVMIMTVDGDQYLVDEIDGDSIFGTDEDGGEVELDINDIDSF